MSDEHRRIVLLRDVSGMSYTEIAQLDYPAMLYVFDSMAPGWGGAFISIAIIVGVAGAWLSFTMLPLRPPLKWPSATCSPSPGAS